MNFINKAAMFGAAAVFVGGVAFVGPMVAGATALECPVGQMSQSVLVTPGTDGTPAVTHTVHHNAVTHTQTVIDVAAYDQVVVIIPAYDEVITDVAEHYDYTYVGHNNGDYDVLTVFHNFGSYDHTTGHTYIYVGSGHGDNSFISAGHNHGDYDRNLVAAVTHTVHHNAVTHTIHHNAVTHQEVVVDIAAYDEVVIDVPAVLGSDPVYENQCVTDPNYVPPTPNVAPVANNIALFTEKNVATSSTATGSDSDGPTALVITKLTDPANGTLSGTFPDFTYTPAADFVGSDSFQFTAGDGLATTTGTVTITVAAVVVQSEQSSSASAKPECSDGIDNDNDGRVDYPGDGSCSDPSDTTEGNDGGGGGGGSFFIPPSTGGGSGGIVLGTSTSNGGSTGGNSGGIVLGASTDAPSCSTPLLTEYLAWAKPNDSTQMVKLQNFLNLQIDAGLKVTGIFDAPTYLAVQKFQLKFESDILVPWQPFGLAPHTATGYVFKTTQHKINQISCSGLNQPAPQLP